MITQNFLKRVLRVLPDGVFAVDLTGKVILWNRVLEEMTGIREEEIVGKADYEYSIPFYGYKRPMPVDYVLNPYICYPDILTKKDDIYEIETFLPLLYGGKGAWVRMSASFIVDEVCDIIGAVQIVRDITYRKNTEIQLERLYKVIQNSPVGILILEFSGNILYYNDFILKLIGVKSLENKNFFEIFPQVSLYEIHNSYLKEIKFGEKILRLRGIRLEEKDLEGYAIFLTDVTELRKYEEQTIISHKMESLRKITATYAHEIKNMLTAVKGFAQLALKADNIEQAKAYVEKVISLSDTVLLNIRKILGFGREVGRNPEKLDLKDVIRNIITFLRGSLREDIDLVFQLEEEKHLTVYADKQDIERIVTNLILNAQDAMPQGGKITVEVKRKYLPEKFKNLFSDKTLDQEYVYLSISDTGIGMDEDTKRKIFEPFFTTKGEKGSGMGLTTVYYIVQLLKGFIFVESEVGKGAKFEIYIPLKEKDY